MALGKAVAAEALELREGALGEVGLVAARDHAADQLVAKRADPAGELEGRHGAAQLVGLAGGEAGAFDGDPHRLLLEQRHAEGLAEHLLELGRRIVDRLRALAPAQVGMHHVALDRAGPDDRDLDDEIVEGPRLDPRQHRHLRAALDLERAERVGLADHRVGARILGRDGREIEVDALVLAQQVEAALHAGQHAEGQAIDLHELQGVDVVLVPFDDLAVGHRRRLDRHELVEPVVGQDEAAGMLRQVARRADQLLGELQRQAQPAVAEVEVELRGVLGVDVLGPAPDRAESVLSGPRAGRAPCRRRAARPWRGSGSPSSRARRGRGRRSRTPTA